MTTPKPDFIRLQGHTGIAARLVLSTLTGKPFHLGQIRPSSPTSPGLAPHEVSLLRLLESLTNGSVIEISYSGTSLTYHPGLLTGGAQPGGQATGALLTDHTLEHRLPQTISRGVSYFLIPLALLAPFCKGHLNVRLIGPGVITAATSATSGDVSVDTFRTALLPLYASFGIPPVHIELRVLQRACAGPNGRGGGGVVEFRSAAQVRLPKTLHLHRPAGRVRRVRGVAYATGVSASHNGRMIGAAREVLSPLGIVDVHVAAQYDAAPLVAMEEGKGAPKRRLGIGFGISLVAEAANGYTIFTADEVAPPEGGVLPEHVGRRCALQLLEAIAKGGCVGSGPAGVMTVIVMMAMGAEDVGRVRLGRDVLACEETIRLARDLKTFGGSAWGVREAAGVDDEGGGAAEYIVSVKGMGVGNVGRKVG